MWAAWVVPAIIKRERASCVTRNRACVCRENTVGAGVPITKPLVMLEKLAPGHYAFEIVELELIAGPIWIVRTLQFTHCKHYVETCRYVHHRLGESEVDSQGIVQESGQDVRRRFLHKSDLDIHK